MSFWNSRTTYHLAVLVVGTILALGSVGCGSRFTGEVNGIVKYKGKPLPGGMVTVLHPDGRIGEGRIQEDGTYSIPNAPGGDVKVKVHTQRPIPANPMFDRLAGTKKGETIYPMGKYVAIPQKYSDPSTSGLSLTVKRGSQEFNIDLTD
jgi:hypothetical protein